MTADHDFKPAVDDLMAVMHGEPATRTRPTPPPWTTPRRPIREAQRVPLVAPRRRRAPFAWSPLRTALRALEKTR